jgi:Zn-finger nucleic acid-binding protein
MSERQGIEIDYCPECRGVWLDRGELDKIIEKSAVATPAFQRSDSDYDKERHYKDDKYRKHKHKSFLGDLFDF